MRSIWCSVVRCKLLIDVVLSIFLPLIGVIYALRNVIFPLNGLIFYGDAALALKFDFGDFTRGLYTWSDGLGASTGYLFLLPDSLWVLVGQSLGIELLLRSKIIILATSPATSMYFAVKILCKEWFPELVGKLWKRIFLSSIASVLYVFNYVNSNITDPIGAAGLQYAYIFLPITFALLVDYLHKGSFKHLLILGLLSMFAAISPIWIVFFSILAVSYLTFLLILERHGKLSLIKRAFLSGIFLIILNMFWILPTLAGYLMSASGPFQVYQPAKRLSFEGMKAAYRLLDAIMFGHKTYNLFGVWPQNWNLINITIPFSAFFAILLMKNRYTIYLCTIAITSTFLLKATNPPFGGLYYWLALHLPDGVGAVLANYGTWAYMQSFSYFFLISLTLLTFMKKGVKRRLYTSIAIILIIALFYSTVNGLYIDSQVYLPRFKPQGIPQVYSDVNNWLEYQPPDIKVLWIPSGGAPFWKGYIVTAFPETISQRTPVSTIIVLKNLNGNTSLEDVVTLFGIKYIIYHDDIIGDNKQLYKVLNESNGFRRVTIFSGTYRANNNSTQINVTIFENLNYKGPLFVTPAGASKVTNYEQVSPVEWKVVVNASGPFILAFTEPYDRLWRAYVNGTEVEPIALYGMVNGFRINQTGIVDIIIYYTLQTYYNLGLLISGASFITLVFMCTRRRLLHVLNIL